MLEFRPPGMAGLRLVPSWSGEGTECLTSQGLKFSICKMGPQTEPLGE